MLGEFLIFYTFLDFETLTVNIMEGRQKKMKSSGHLNKLLKACNLIPEGISMKARNFWVAERSNKNIKIKSALKSDLDAQALCLRARTLCGSRPFFLFSPPKR